MVQISSVPALDDDTRHLAMELILTVVEAKPGMVRKHMPDLVSQIFQIGLTWMLELDDSSPWTITGTEVSLAPTLPLPLCCRVAEV